MCCPRVRPEPTGLLVGVSERNQKSHGGPPARLRRGTPGAGLRSGPNPAPVSVMGGATNPHAARLFTR
jgi:hypothetical protein